tara:strand:- start:5063 stop:6166 length:1104 start_codon:yes stop_codon:yes gene_type:complete
VAKSVKKLRGKFTDEKYLGTEPDLRGETTISELIGAYNWYNYFYNAEQAKGFVLEYLRDQKKKDLAKRIAKVAPDRLKTIGWNCRILFLGGNLPEGYEDRLWENLTTLSKQPVKNVAVVDTPIKPVISIQERVARRASELIGELEEVLDAYTTTRKTTFNISKWLMQKDVKPAIAQRIADKYKPVYSELYDALQGKDADLKFAYSHWKKTDLKKYVELVRSFISESEKRANAIKSIRKVRTKKVKPAAILVKSLKVKDDEGTLKLTGVKPVDIIGASQLWIYNTKYRSLTVLYAMGPAGLSVKGTTVIGFDEKTSKSKKLRKPEFVIKEVLGAGKVALKRIMDGLKTKESAAKGRCNADTMLLKVVR